MRVVCTIDRCAIRLLAKLRHLVALAAELIRRILVDAARARCSLKRGGEYWRTTIGATMALPNAPTPELIDLDKALDILTASYPRIAVVAELRYFRA